MRLAEYTDYTLRVLMYCAAHADQRVTIADLAERHAVSKNHLMKIVNDLARRGLIETTRGRGGGLRLRADPARLRIGDIVRHCETDFRLVECFAAAGNECSLTPSCRLKHLFAAALEAFFRTLDSAALADLVLPAAQHGRPPPARGGRGVVVTSARRRGLARAAAPVLARR